MIVRNSGNGRIFKQYSAILLFLAAILSPISFVAQEGSIVIFDLTNEIVLQNGPNQIVDDYAQGKKWVAYFHASIPHAGGGLTFSIDLADI